MGQSNMKSFRMLYEEEQKSETQQALDALKAEVNVINEYLFKLLDKYTIAGGSYKYVCIIDKEKNVQWSLNNSGNLPQIEDNRRMLINVINEYDIFYKKIIAKSAALKKEKVLKEKSNLSRITDALDAFPFLEKAKFSADITNNINACKNVYEYMFNNINFTSLSVMTNEKFYQEIQKIKNDLSGMSVDKIPNETKIESELEDVPAVIKNDYKPDESEEQSAAEVPEVPSEIEQSVEKAAEAVEAVKDHTEGIDPSKVLDNFNKTKQAVIDMEKNVNAWIEKQNSKALKNKLKNMQSKLKDIIGKTWGYTQLLNLKSMFGESLRASFFNLLLEDDSQQKSETNTENSADEKEDIINNVKTIIDKVDALLTATKFEEFIKNHKTWVDEIEKAFNSIAENANDETKAKLDKIKDKDPYEKICELYSIITSKNKENSKDKTNSTDEQGNSDADTAGSRPDSEDINDKEMGDGLTAESLENEFVVHNFLKHLNEYFH